MSAGRRPCRRSAAVKRESVCGVSAISGTSTIAPRSRARACLAGAEVDLGLAASGRTVEQEVGRRPLVEAGNGDALDRVPPAWGVGVGRRRGSPVRASRARRARAARGPPLADVGCDEGERPGRRRSRNSRRSRARGRPARAAGSSTTASESAVRDSGRRLVGRGLNTTTPRFALLPTEVDRPRPCPCARHPGRRT